MPTQEQIFNVAKKALTMSDFSFNEDTFDICLIPFDFGDCNIQSLIYNHVLNCKENEAIMSIYKKDKTDIVFVKYSGIKWEGKDMAPKKLAYKISSWDDE